MSGRSTLDATLAAVDLQRIDAICDQFEAQWRTGQRPDLAVVLVGSAHRGKGCPFSRSPEHSNWSTSVTSENGPMRNRTMSSFLI